MDDYKIKSTDYYNNIREDVLAYIPTITNAKLLDIGCSSGNLLCYLKQKQIIAYAVGVDFMSIANSNQQNTLIDKFIEADLQKMDINLPKNSFDIMVCADVLEHLLDPWMVLAYLQTFLKKDGHLIVSLPNIKEYTALKKIIINGDFQYAASGILDKTHLRFFCKKNIVSLVNNAGFTIVSCEPSFKTGRAHKKRKLINKLTFGIFEQFLAQQYIVVALNK